MGADINERHRAVLDLLADGRSNADIAGAVHLSEKTVKNLVSEILARVGVANRTQAALWWIEEKRKAAGVSPPPAAPPEKVAEVAAMFAALLEAARAEGAEQAWDQCLDVVQTQLARRAPRR